MAHSIAIDKLHEYHCFNSDGTLTTSLSTILSTIEVIAIEAMKWEDKQYEQEKQQWIEKAVIFLNERVCTGMSIPEIHNMIVDFRKSMKGV